MRNGVFTSLNVSLLLIMTTLALLLGLTVFWRNLKHTKDFMFTQSNLSRKKIWLFDEDSWKAESQVAQKVRESWTAFNPDWTVVWLDDANLGEYVDLSPGSLLRRMRDENAPSHAFSGMLRLLILRAHGGIWADSTTLCMDSLDDWLYDKLLPCGLWMYHGTNRGEGPANFFIASTRHSYMLTTWTRACEEYWMKRHLRDQCEKRWQEAVFEKLCLSDETFRGEWSSVPYLWCEAFGQPNLLLSHQQQAIDPETQHLLVLSPPHVLQLPPDARSDAVVTALDACLIRQRRLPNASSAAALSPSRHVTLHPATETLRRELPPSFGNLLVISDCGCRTSLERIVRLCKNYTVTPLVYDKCNFCAEVPAGTYCRPLRNVGRDFGTLFWFLSRYYAVIPDEAVLFFSAGNMLKHDRERRLTRLLAGETVAATNIGNAETFTIQEYEGKPLRASGSENFRAWYEKFVGTWDPARPGACWNGLLRISGAEIRRIPLSTLINVATSLALEDGLEAVHYVERCVHAILFPMKK